MTIDEEGMLWVAMCMVAPLLRIDPESGNCLQQIEFPCIEQPPVLLVDSTRSSFCNHGIHSTLEEQDAGKVFVVDGIGVAGTPGIPFRN